MDTTLLQTWLHARLRCDERGANLMEYLLLIAFIAFIIVVSAKVFGQRMSSLYSSATSNLQ